MQGKEAEVRAKKMEQASLRFFHPIMAHSWTGGARQVFFHGQMLIDFQTIEMIGEKLLDELAIASREATAAFS
jgi:hypothetical protein